MNSGRFIVTGICLSHGIVRSTMRTNIIDRRGLQAAAAFALTLSISLRRILTLIPTPSIAIPCFLPNSLVMNNVQPLNTFMVCESFDDMKTNYAGASGRASLLKAWPVHHRKCGCSCKNNNDEFS